MGWAVPAWQCVTMTASMTEGWIWFCSRMVELWGGGSIMTPRRLTHSTYPDVDPFGSKPWLLPSTVTPNMGGAKSLVSGPMLSECRSLSGSWMMPDRVTTPGMGPPGTSAEGQSKCSLGRWGDGGREG